MDVDVAVGEKVRIEAEVRGVAADVAQGGLGRLLEHGAQGAGEDQLLVPPHAGGLHEDDFAAEFGPDQARGHPHLVVNLRHFVGEFPGPQERLHQVLVHAQGAGPLALDADAGQFAADHGDFPFQVPQARLPGVPAG